MRILGCIVVVAWAAGGRAEEGTRPVATADSPATVATPSPVAAEQSAPAPSAPAPSPTPAAPRPGPWSETRQLAIGRVQVTVAAADEPAARAAIAKALGEVDRVDALLSERRPGSETSRLDAAGGKPVQVGPELRDLVARGQELSRLTGGAVALTAGALTSLWPFDAPADLRVPPPPPAVSKALATVGDDRIVVDRERGTLQLPAGTRLELRSVLRGHALARALAVMAEVGIHDALVAVAGAVAASGKKGAGPWVVGIQDPRASGYFAVLPVTDEAVVTRGDYERFFERDGRRYDDVLDPRTGQPAAGCRSVTIVGADPVLADALATAVMVLGPEAGMGLVERTPGVGAAIVTAGNEVVVSPSLRDRLRILRPPTS